MAEFSGKIIEAYFSNSEKDTICIMWNNDAGGKETLEEFSIDTNTLKLDTLKRNY